MHSSTRHYLTVVSWLCIIHIPIGLTLIIAVSRWNQLDIGCFGKCGFLHLVASQIGIIRQLLLFTVALIVYVTALLVLIVIIHIPILIHRWQLPANCTNNHLKSEWSANRELTLVVIAFLQAGCGVHSSIVKDAMTRAPVVKLPTAAQARYVCPWFQALVTTPRGLDKVSFNNLQTKIVYKGSFICLGRMRDIL